MEARLDGVRFSRPGGFLLDIPELRFASGRVTALLGANGSGKSTVLRLLAGILRPGRGSVSPPPRAHHVAMAFQESVFLRGTVRANIDLALRLRSLPAAERERRLDDAARASGIPHLLDRDARALSGGEARRANLARALAVRAPITLLDEPLAGLDVHARRELLHELPGLLAEFATTAVLVTHDRDEALHLADDVVVLLDGRVRAAGPKSDVYRAPPNVETAEFLGFTVVERDGALAAVMPGAFRAGPGDVEFPFTFERLVDLGTRRELVGRVHGALVTVRLADGIATGEPPAVVSAPASAVVTFPGP